jgi:hypothetical protein
MDFKCFFTVTSLRYRRAAISALVSPSYCSCYDGRVLAHSGATIGVGDTETADPVDGEVPTSYPTILQQCDLFTGLRDKVDLVLMDGGMNDVDVTTILNPFNPANLDELLELHLAARSWRETLRYTCSRPLTAKTVN